MTTAPSENDPADAIIPAKMTRIESLMKRLEAGPLCAAHEHPEHPDRVSDEKTIKEARQLILDLLGLSEKLQGESIYEAHCKRIAAAYGHETGDLTAMIVFVKRWIPECWPATEGGQVPFARALVEALLNSAEAHLKIYPERPAPKWGAPKANIEG